MSTPQRFGPRVVKGRTQRQQAAARKYNAFQTQPTTVDANPKDSWWIGKNRAELQAAVAQEQRRIAWSRCGRISDPKFAG